MTNEELIAKIKAELERLKNDWASLEDELTDAMVAEYDYLLDFLTTLESEKPMNPDDAMKELDEKIALVKQRGTWDGVDVDKYMDEVRGREPEKPIPADLEEAAEKYLDKMFGKGKHQPFYKELFIAGAKWQYQKDRAEFAKLKAKEWSDGYDEGIAKGKEQIMDEWLKDRDGCFWDGVEEGKKAMKEQMMKEAVAEVEVGMRGDPIEIILDKYVQRAMGIFPGDKVRVIVCKKEDEK